ncbi:MAG: hypothetical protein ABSH56_11375 [Bryobacteraceae bacterium]|jgi:hypothetical protein
MHTRDPITPEELGRLLQAADGDMDRLLRGLQKILKEREVITEDNQKIDPFDTFPMLCVEVRSRVLIR